MIKNYLKIAWRNILKNKVSSIINIGGLAVGMTVSMLIGFWTWDELSYDKFNPNYNRIAQVMQNQTLTDNIATWSGVPYPLGAELRKSYGSNFKYVVTSSGAYNQILSTEEKKITKNGVFMEPAAPEMLNLNMLKGTRAGLTDPSSILISQSTANAYFGNADPMGKRMKIDALDVNVTGVYADLPNNSAFAGINFIAPWELRFNNDKWLKGMDNPWGNNSFQVLVQLADNANMSAVSTKIKNVKLHNIHKEETVTRPKLFLQPMSKWHLYSDFKNGVNTGGRIEFVWLFGIIGFFVLLLACINFMHLSTARSEKRAKEVGIRKAIGSMRRQLISQFFSESLLVSLLAFALSLVLVQLLIPGVNQIADKQIAIAWNNPLFWLSGIVFSLITGLMAGSYPALYLSSFTPVKVLKGTFRVGRLAAIPRKVLVVIQFTVSIVLIIGTTVVFRQIQFARNRPIGYNRSGLVAIETHNADIHNHFKEVRTELKNAGAITEMAESANPITAVWRTNGGFTWNGKDPRLTIYFPTNGISYDYGKLVGWQISQGRDLSSAYPSDSSAFILNETAVKYMGLKNPVGETIKWSDGVAFKVIGVVKDMIMESPYEPVRPSFYFLNRNPGIVNVKINPLVSPRDALSKIETAFKKFSPAQPFEYSFVDDEYAKKFGNEERVGKLAGFFSGFAIFISCLGLFGMASFVAEQRFKEIGVRKVLGASVFNLWQLLSKDFVTLVIISLLIAIPVSYYFMHNWLQHYTYRSDLAWWIYAVTGIGVVTITLLTVSYQSIKAALANPVKSLKSE